MSDKKTVKTNESIYFTQTDNDRKDYYIKTAVFEDYSTYTEVFEGGSPEFKDYNDRMFTGKEGTFQIVSMSV